MTMVPKSANRVGKLWTGNPSAVRWVRYFSSKPCKCRRGTVVTHGLNYNTWLARWWLALGPDKAGSCQRPGLTWAWAWSSSRAGFQDTINAGGSDAGGRDDRGTVGEMMPVGVMLTWGVVSRFKAPSGPGCLVGPLRPAQAAHCLPWGWRWPIPQPVHRCRWVFLRTPGVVGTRRRI